MPRFLRAFVPGGTFFFTLVTYRRRPILVLPDARTRLRQSIREVQQRRPFTVEGLVLLPDHLHLLVTLPRGDCDFSTRLRKVKEGFTRSYISSGGVETTITKGQERKGLRGVWQPRFWEHTIRDERDFGRHMDYIHFNPVKDGHARCPHRWPWSTFQRWVRAGIYSADWCCGCARQTVQPPDFDDLAGTAME